MGGKIIVDIEIYASNGKLVYKGQTTGTVKLGTIILDMNYKLYNGDKVIFTYTVPEI